LAPSYFIAASRKHEHDLLNGVNLDRTVEAFEHDHAEVLERQTLPHAQFGYHVGDQALLGLCV
jgi:hypothetical protein